VNRTSKFTPSKRLYAVGLDSLRVDESGEAFLGAVWFRRKRLGYTGPVVTAACSGVLWDFQQPRPETAAQFLAAADDGRYGAHCLARWDGDSLWFLGSEEDRARHLGILRPMLAAYPEVPPGWDGWWAYPKS
jgi:hypothetical protein